MSIDKYDVTQFRGKGNAIYVVEFINKEFPPLTWNLIAIKIIKSLRKFKLRPSAISENDEFTDEVLREINNILVSNYNSKLPIF